jgi:hypothetical protein
MSRCLPSISAAKALKERGIPRTSSLCSSVRNADLGNGGGLCPWLLDPEEICVSCAEEGPEDKGEKWQL